MGGVGGFACVHAQLPPIPHTWDAIFTAIIGIGLQPSVLLPMPGSVVNGLFATLLGQIGAVNGTIGMCAMFYAGVQVVGVEGYCLLYRLAVILRTEGVHRGLMSWWGMATEQAIAACAGLAIAVPMYTFTVESLRSIPPPDFIDTVNYPHMAPLKHPSDYSIIFLDPTSPSYETMPSAFWRRSACGKLCASHLAMPL